MGESPVAAAVVPPPGMAIAQRGHGADGALVAFDFHEERACQNPNRLPRLQSPFAKNEIVQVQTHRQLVELGGRTTQLLHSPACVLTIDGHDVSGPEESLIDPGTLLARYGGKIIAVKTHHERRAPKFLRESKTIPHRPKMGVQYIESFPLHRQFRQSMQGRQTRGLITILAAKL